MILASRQLRNRLTAAGLAFSMFASACASTRSFPTSSATGATQAPAGELAKQAPTQEPDLAPGFMIQLSSSKDPNLNGAFRIEPNGEIKLPYNIKLSTRGMSWAQFNQALESAYQPYFKGTPQISATVQQKRYWVEVRGLVAKPGEYLVRRDSPLDDVISQAGGLTDDLVAGFVRVKQGTQISWINLGDYFSYGASEQVPLWVGGDQVFFQKEGPQGGEAGGAGRQLQILGEVKNPGELIYKPGVDVYYYLGKAGGPTQSANLERVEVIRASSPGDQHGSRNRQPVWVGELAETPQLQEGDVLIVHAEKTTRFEKGLQYTSAIASIVSIIVALIVVGGR